jgi:hypothetical protein
MCEKGVSRRLSITGQHVVVDMSLPGPAISGFGQKQGKRDLAKNRAKADLFGGIPRRRVIRSSVLSFLLISNYLRLLEGESDVFKDDEAREPAGGCA